MQGEEEAVIRVEFYVVVIVGTYIQGVTRTEFWWKKQLQPQQNRALTPSDLNEGQVDYGN